MVVVVLEKCPFSLRGDLSKWLLEVSFGVYVGKVSARVRDALWERICSECKGGRATMVFSARNEQGLEFRTHNSQWYPVDFDGLKLIMRPGQDVAARVDSHRFKAGGVRARPIGLADYVVVDIETTGLDSGADEIIEIGALKVRAEEVAGRFSALVRCNRPVPDSVLRLTGITSEGVHGGEELADVLERFGDFVELLPWVGFNVEFDFNFINSACDECDVEPFDVQLVDILRMAKKTIPRLSRYRLGDVAEYLGVPTDGQHRALRDCEIAQAVLEKLME